VLLATAAFLAASLVGGCAHSDAGGVPQTQRVAGATYKGPLTRTIKYPNLGFTFAPPKGRTAVLSPADAFAGNDFYPSSTTTPTMYLVLVTTQMGGIVQADGSVKDTIVDRLAYALIWKGFTCSPVGGPAPPGSSAAPIRTFKNCTAVSVIDATTGKGLGAAGGSGTP
jgi:hypothetical protein